MKVTVVKIGGNVVDSPEALAAFLSDFSRLEGAKILVHGGGKIATELAGKLGVETRMVEGRRITSPQMLNVAVMTYAGLINKRITAALQALGCNAIGMSGADGMAIVAHRRPVSTIDYGEVGDVDSVNSSLFRMLIDGGFTPVVCAITCDAEGHLLNTNADTIASAIACGVSAFASATLIYCFEKKGVLRSIADEDSVIEHINAESFERLKSDGVIAAGMIPKITNSLKAVAEGGVQQVVIKSSAELLQDSGTKICL